MDDCTCGVKGTPVTINLVRHHLTAAWQHSIEGKSFTFCEEPGCPVVYFAGDGTTFDVAAVRAAPAYKSGDKADRLCFCFDVTGQDVLGDSDPTPYVRERVRQGECACDVLNPSGMCCLGSIGRWVKAHS